MKCELLIIGSGPAGNTAALYAARGGINVIQVSGEQLGGQLTSTSEIENFPGVKKISGIGLMDIMNQQVKSLGVELLYDSVKSVQKFANGFTITTDYSGDIFAKSVIIATGAKPKLLGIEGEKEYWSRGVSTCATCDGFFCKDKDVLVVGGGNTAVEDAMYLSGIAKSVTLIHRRDSLRAEKTLQEKLFQTQNIDVIWNTELKQIKGDQESGKLSHAVLYNNRKKRETELAVGHVFIAIGYSPNSALFKGLVHCDDEGYIVTDNTRTNVEGIFAAGDVQDPKYRQAVISAGSGAIAAIEAQKYLMSSPL